MEMEAFKNKVNAVIGLDVAGGKVSYLVTLHASVSSTARSRTALIKRSVVENIEDIDTEGKEAEDIFNLLLVYSKLFK